MAHQATAATVGQSGMDELVNVAVPRRLYPEMIQFLATAMGTGDEGPAAPVSAQEDSFRKWRRDDVRRLKQETQIPSVVALFDLVEQKGGDPVGIAELEQSTGKTLGQVRGDLIRLSSFAKKELGQGDTWPFWAEDGPDGRAQYRVPENVRSWWREA